MSSSTPTTRPNIVVVIFDDTGWSNFGCFGSEIATPTIDRLAERGAHYTNFHVTPLCSPTRAAVLTGRNPHRIGMAWLADLDLGMPARRGRVDERAAMLPRYLADADYLSYLIGKWHLTPQSEVGPGGPYREWPLAKGFDRFYGFLEGCTDHYGPELVEDNHVLDWRADSDDYHLTSDLVDRALRYLSDHQTFNAERPFFLQLAFGATHAPFQAPSEFIKPYVEVFEKGWDRTRADRLERQIELGLLPPGTELADRPANVPAWDSLGEQQRELAVALQAAFAGFLTHTDAELGRFLNGLDDLRIGDDTVVLVLSDNGSADDGQELGAPDVLTVWNGIDLPVEGHHAYVDELLENGARSQYPEGWAMAGNTPFPRYKQFVDAGGVRSPLIVHGPGVTPGQRQQFLHAVDILPTLLDLAGIAPPDTVDGTPQLPIDGASFAATLGQTDSAAVRTTQYFELAGVRAIWHDGWKAISVHTKGADYDLDTWRLYDTAADPSERTDLAAAEPDRLADLLDRFEQAASDNNVYPLDDRSLTELLSTADPIGCEVLRLYPTGSHTSSHTYVAGSRRAGKVNARVDTSGGWVDGPLVSSGTPYSGYRLAIDGAEIVLNHNFLRADTELRVPLPDPPHDMATVSLLIDGPADGIERRLTVAVDGAPLADTTVPYTGRRLNFWGLDVGPDRGWTRSPANPTLKSVTLELGEAAGEALMAMSSE